MFIAQLTNRTAPTMAVMWRFLKP